jgi:hypothetical protein
MRCLRPDCGSVAADELNVSVNVSFTYEQEELEYTGETDYMDPLVKIGTWCSECERTTLLPDWQAAVIKSVEER